MSTTIEQQVALDKALVPSTKRLRIGRSNFRLPSDIQSKESTLQVVYDVLRQSPFFKAFLVTADVPEIYMEMLHISLRVPGQSFAELPFEEEILEFLRFLGHSAQIKTLTDVNVNKLYHPWRSFVAVINKCVSGKCFGIDSLREDFVYQVEHKNQKKSNEMYYPRFTKVIIHHFMTRKPSIPRRDKAYKEYYACATRDAAPKPKVSARKKKGGSALSTTPPTPIATPTPTTTIVAAPRLSAAAKGK
nr:hypothetical protein [Tanacetum cinerariifolium]